MEGYMVNLHMSKCPIRVANTEECLCSVVDILFHCESAVS